MTGFGVQGHIYYFFSKTGRCSLAFYESAKTTGLAWNILYWSIQEKSPYIMDGLRESNLNSKFSFLGELSL